MAENRISIKEILSDCLENYKKARQLIEEESKNDPESEPYKSKYSAKEVLSDIKTFLMKALDDLAARNCTEVDQQQNLEISSERRLQLLLAAVNYNLGVIAIETEELSTGEEHLAKCLEILQKGGCEHSQESILILLRALNQMGLLKSMLGNNAESVKYLEQAESACKTYKNKIGSAPYDVMDIFKCSAESARNHLSSESNLKTLEQTLTHTLYYLAQAYGSLNETEKSAIYCHTTLRRQLDSKEFDSVDWALNCATLSQYFIAQNSFRDARHHLACATRILDTYEADLRAEESGNAEHDELIESINHRRADLARCWAKYGILLLSVSWDKLMRNSMEEIVDEMQQAHLSEDTQADVVLDHNEQEQNSSNVAVKPHMVFKSLEVTSLEEQITSNFVLDFDQARAVFLNAKNWLSLAKEYYTFADHATDHVHIIQDMSKLYKVLAYFEQSEDRRCKMHKRRVDIIESATKELNPQYYLNECRQLYFELAETYSEIMDLKLTIIRESNAVATQHAIQKINHMAEQSMNCFQSFIDTFLDNRQKMPEEFPEELVRPVLLAYFCMARLHSKIITDDTEAQLLNCKKSLDCYKYLANYCDKHPSAASVMSDELGVVKEMIQLLPVKLDRIMNAAS